MYFIHQKKICKSAKSILHSCGRLEVLWETMFRMMITAVRLLQLIALLRNFVIYPMAQFWKVALMNS